MKKIYSSPELEIVRLSASCGICNPPSKTGEFNNGGGTTDYDPINDGL